MIRLPLYFLLPLAGAIALAGCSGGELRQQLGLVHQGPDPFAITTNKPLELPEDTALPVPQPGKASRVNPSPLDTVRRILGVSVVEAASAGSEESLLAALGVTEADPGIRELVDQEAEQEREAIGVPLVHKWLGFADRAFRDAHILDPAAETERLRAAGLVSYPGGGGER